MTTLLEIETAIQKLPEPDIRKLSGWLQSYMEDTWDQEIAADLESGKLDHLIAHAELDISANRLKSMNEVFNNS